MDYQNLLQQFGMIVSMSRKGDCYDNAPMESFWGHLKLGWCLIGNSRHGNKQFWRLPSKSRSSTTGRESKKDWAICHQQNLHVGTMQIYSPLKLLDSIFDSIPHSIVKRCLSKKLLIM